MARRLTQEHKVYIVRAFTEELRSMIDLAEQFGVTRQTIWKVIKQAGVDISSQSMVKVSCTACGLEITRERCRIRGNINHFCDNACYQAYLDAGNGHTCIPDRHGQRLGRAAVLRLFKLLPGHIVHHEDRNCLNNDPVNLKVFANQGDHIRYHRLGAAYVQPIWEGNALI